MSSQIVDTARAVPVAVNAILPQRNAEKDFAVLAERIACAAQTLGIDAAFTLVYAPARSAQYFVFVPDATGAFRVERAVDAIAARNITQAWEGGRDNG